MANVLAPFGFRPVRLLNGSPWSGKLTERRIQNAYATAMFRGDLVQVAATGYVTRSAAGGARASGVFMGCRYYDTSAAQWRFLNHYPASAPANGDPICQIIDDPNVVFEAQVGAAGTIAFADIGANIDIIATAGSTLDGISDESLDAATIATTATLPWRIVDRSVAPDNDNASANNHALVKLNSVDYATTTGL